MPERPSMVGRAVVALALVAGFYLLALGLAGGLLFLAYLEVTGTTRSNPRAIVFCLAGAAAILWSIVPRRDLFAPPGPRIDPKREPRLFRLLEEVALACGEAMPSEVYLLGSVNAFVTQRGGFAGHGGRRVMGIGLPLFTLLSTDELRAVVAHEFGHFHGGDLKLGPWIYQTRAAIGRTIEQLQRKRNVLRFPFILYGRLFRRVTLSIARAQELAADALAVRIAGAAAHASALEKTHAFDGAHDEFWSEASAVLRAGFRPRLGEGFAICLAQASVRQRAANRLRKLKESDTTAPDDTHPSLHRRLAAIGEGAAAPSERSAAGDAGRAASLLDHEEELERVLVDGLVPPQQRIELRPIEWRDVDERVTFPRLNAIAGREPAALAGLTLRDLPRRIRELNQEFGQAAAGPARDAVMRKFDQLRCAALVAYVRGGFALRSPPGEALWLVRDATRRDVYSDAVALSDESLSEADWIARCEADGVAAQPLLAPA